MWDRKQVLTILYKQTKMINKRLKCSTATSKKMLKYNKNNYKYTKDYNYNQIDGYFAWPTRFISVCNLIWGGSDCHVIISYRDVKITILNFIYTIYVWKLHQTVLEVDLWANNNLFFRRRDLSSHHWYDAAPIA
jgi:hypothetical protein